MMRWGVEHFKPNKLVSIRVMHCFFSKYFFLSIAIWVQTNKKQNNFIAILFFYIRLTY